MKTNVVVLLAAFLAVSAPVYAAVVVEERPVVVSHWRTVDTPVGGLFHFVGDVVAFPFHVLGDLL